ncbi:hypothetical protein [Actinoplanes sp. GCM10030250]|uniref:hypothetical protein n=1 Tax=Actinoplanes sp. GCM10030250 TaxID=3273376 RepID=UPI003617695B
MTNKRSIGGLLHRATHRVPGAPAHAERPAGHQGATAHARALRRGPVPQTSWNHSPARPPRFLPAWQRWIAAMLGRELS